jgi:butyryl-CoA dehydrogenase
VILTTKPYIGQIKKLKESIVAHSSRLRAFFVNKTVLITGAGSGIGKGLAQVFAELGCKLAICDIDQAALKSVEQELVASNPELVMYSSVLDVSKPENWDIFLADAESKCEYIDVVINNAGIEGSCKPVWASSDETLKRVMDVNFYGMVHGSKASLPYLVKRPWAALLNVSSIFGLLGVPNTADYCASKFAIRGFTESLRAELLMIHPHVQVHLIHPGGVNTNITRIEQSQKFKERFLTTAPRDIAMHIALSIMQNKPRIVYGNQANKTHFATRLLSLNWLNKLSGNEIKGLGMEEDYTADHEGFHTKKS